MLDAWIKSEDVLKLLSKMETIGNCIEKKRFLFEIHRLKQYKKPKKPPQQRTINYSKAIIKEIENYRNAVENGERNYLQKQIDIQGESDKVHFAKYFDAMYGNDKYINIIPAENLKDIIKVSDRTIKEWNKKNIIRLKYIEGHQFNTNFYYYDLSEIKVSITPSLKGG